MPRTADGVAPTTWCSKSFCPGLRRVQIGPMDANEWHERHFGDVRRYSARAAAEDASMSSDAASKSPGKCRMLSEMRRE